MAEADAEDRHRRTEALDGGNRDAGVLGTARAGRNHDPRRRQRRDLVQRDLVVAAHRHLGAELAQVLGEVEGERIVVVDQEDHHRSSRCASSRARKSACALLRVSSYSVAGTESATMPAPAWTWATPSRSTSVRMAMQQSRLPAKSR